MDPLAAVAGDARRDEHGSVLGRCHSGLLEHCADTAAQKERQLLMPVEQTDFLAALGTHSLPQWPRELGKC